MKKYMFLVMSVISVIVIAGFARALAIELSADTITTGKGKQTHTNKMYLKGEKYPDGDARTASIYNRQTGQKCHVDSNA